MSPKFVFLFFASYLLVQSSLGKVLPEQTSKKDHAAETNTNATSSNEVDCMDEFVHRFIREVLKAVGQVTKGELSVREVEGFLLRDVKLVSYEYIEFCGDEEHKKFFNPDVESDIETHIHLLLNSFYHSPRYENLKEIAVSEYENLSDKRLIFVAEQFRNIMDLIKKMIEREINAEQALANIVNFYRESVQKYYNAMTKEEQERKRPYADYVEKLTSSDTNDSSSSEEGLAEAFPAFFDLSEFEQFKIESLLGILEVERKTDKTLPVLVKEIEGIAEDFYESTMNDESDMKEVVGEFLNKLKNLNDVEEQYRLINKWFGLPGWVY